MRGRRTLAVSLLVALINACAGAPLVAFAADDCVNNTSANCLASSSPLQDVNVSDSATNGSSGSGSSGGGAASYVGLGVAAGGIAMSFAADAMCVYVIPNTSCPPGSSPVPHGCEVDGNQFMVPNSCIGTVAGFPIPIPGTCVLPHKCQALSAPGIGGIGNALVGVGVVAAAVTLTLSLLSKSASGGAGSGSGSDASGSYGNNAGTICTTFTPVNDPALASQPCTYYVAASPIRSTTVSSATSLDSLLGSDASTSDGAQAVPDSGISMQQSAVPAVSSEAPPAGALVEAPSTGTTRGIRYFDTGLTFFASTQSNGAAVSAFYGASATGDAQRHVAARICAARPWSASTLPLLSSAAFDRVCADNNLTVDSPGAMTGTSVSTGTPSNAIPAVLAPVVASTPSAVLAPAVPPSAEIWAVPSSVAPGSRASIFWRSAGVVSCTETAADGSFSHAELFGPANTAPLSVPTTITISCLDPTGQRVTDSVTVGITK